jgi:hypothetical protein
MPRTSNELKGLQEGAKSLTDKELLVRTKTWMRWAYYLDSQAEVAFLCFLDIRRVSVETHSCIEPTRKTGGHWPLWSLARRVLRVCASVIRARC